MIALLLASQAFALDSSSLRATSTFDLFRDPYDFLMQPGLMAAEDERGLVTMLSYYNAPGRYAIGYYGKLGPGVLGSVVDYGSSGSTSETKDTSKYPDGQTVTDSDSESSANAWAAQLSYGIPVSDSFAFGLAFRMDQSGQTSSFDPTSGTVGGSRTDIDISDGDDTKSYGLAKYKDRTMQVLLGGAIYGDKGYFSLDAGLQTLLNSATVDAGWEYVDSKITYKGYVPGTTLDGNRTGKGPMARLEMVRAMGDQTDLRLTADFGMISGKPQTQTSVYATEDTDTSYTQTEQLKNAKFKSSSWGVLTAVHYEGDDISIRPGLRLSGGGYNQAYTPASSYKSVFGDTTDEGASEGGDYTDSVKVLTFGLPLAVEIPLGDEERWTLRMAGEWDWTRTKLESTYFDEDTDAETSTKDVADSVSTATAVAGSFGLRFKPVDRFRLDAATFNSTSFPSGGSDTFAIGSVWLSGTFLFR